MRLIHALAPLSLSAALTLSLGLSPAPRTGPAARSASAPPAQPLATDDESPLARAMEGLQNGMRELRGLSKGTDDKGACLDVLHAMQTSAIAALQLEPPLPEGQEPPPAETLAVWKIEYKRQILKLVDKLYELEVAVVEGRFEALQAGFSELSEIKNDGHYEYQE